MEQQGRRRNKYALLLVTENKEGIIRQRHINSLAVDIVAAALFLIIVAFTCKVIYDAITLKDARNQIIDQIATINNLTDENEALEVENDSLSSKITVLGESVSQKMAAEDAISKEIVESALPKGFPISGSATMKEAEEENPMLIFTAVQGLNVVSTGTGTVVSVDVDMEYGTKIIIDHENGYYSIYRNGGTALVKLGEKLGKGYILFSIGEDNKTLGYQITKNDTYVNPLELLDING